jgi:protein-tyrosine phosphatase
MKAMYQIRPWLFVGSFRDTVDDELLERHQIGALLQLASPAAPPRCPTLVLMIEDGEPIAPATLEHGVEFVAQAHARGVVCLIACGAGISRSVVFATAALCRIEGLALLDAATTVKRANPAAVFHPVLWDSLVEFTGEPVPFREVLLRLGP